MMPVVGVNFINTVCYSVSSIALV